MLSFLSLYTYRNIEELRRIQNECDVVPCIVGETFNMLNKNSEICIDISALIYLLRVENNNRYAATAYLKKMPQNIIVIVEELLAEDTIKIFPYLFNEIKPYFDEETLMSGKDLRTHIFCHRRTVYTYNNAENLTSIIDYANKNDIPIATFSQASGDFREEFERFNKSKLLALLDLTSVSYALNDNKNLIYTVELFLNLFPNSSIISLTSQVDELFRYFPLYLDGQLPINKLIPELALIGTEEPETDKVKKITNLSDSEFETLIGQFNYNLIGHNYFKQRLKYTLSNFIILNKVKDQKVFSIFLFGVSGIGKTEVARLIANGLQRDCYLAKINFQNYSSQDALNSLIGSPAGYVGCNHGELSEKIQNSKVGVLLCDEFEKTNRPVFSFFLELLEEGRFTDSMAREYNLDGYIIIFTSNIQNESEYKKTIPLELQTRFDLVCEFEAPSLVEKKKFLELLLEKAQTKYSAQFNQIQITDIEKQELYNFDYSNISALRDIKRIFNNRLMDFFNKKGVFRDGFMLNDT